MVCPWLIFHLCQCCYHAADNVMMMSSNGKIFCITGPPRHWPFVRGIHRWPVNSPHKWPVTRSFDVFFDLPMNNQLSKQSKGWWREIPLCSLWHHCSVVLNSVSSFYCKSKILMLWIKCIFVRCDRSSATVTPSPNRPISTKLGLKTIKLISFRST